MTDSNGKASWTALIAEAMKNPLLYVGAIFVIVGAAGQIPYLKVPLLDGMQYVLVLVGIVLLGFGGYSIFAVARSRGAGGAEHIDAGQYGIEIVTPFRSQTVDVPLTIAGAYKTWPPSPYQLWLITRRDGFYRPGSQIDKIGNEQKWAVTYSTHHRGRQANIGVYLVGTSGQALIAAYFRCCETIKRLNPNEPWPGIASLGSDIVLCDQRDLAVK
jgi:hypothetical protein